MNFKELLLNAPEGHLDPGVRPLIEEWHGDSPTAVQALKLLDNCARYALASEFTMRVLEVALQQALTREGLTREDVVNQAIWRKEMDNKEKS
jgi:hypothetical protein